MQKNPQISILRLKAIHKAMLMRFHYQFSGGKRIDSCASHQKFYRKSICFLRFACSFQIEGEFKQRL
jgi:hypothetical protein